MNQELKNKIFNIVSKNKCPYKSEYGTICLSDISRIDAFEQSYPFLLFYRQLNDERYYIDFRTGQRWKTLVQNKYNCCGRRISKAIIDSTISDKVFIEITIPMIGLYCSSVEFFE